MKILHVLSSPRAEGTPRIVLDWLSVSAYDQEILFLQSEGDLKSQFQDTGRVCYFNSEFKLSFRNAFQIIRIVKRVTKKSQVDVVISWPTGFSQWIHIGAWLAGVRRLLVHAGNPPGHGFIKRYLMSYLSFWIGRILGNKVICCSEYVRSQFECIWFMPESYFHAVPNCFRVSSYLSNGSVVRNPFQAIMVATLEPHKDHETLLSAWEIVSKYDAKYTLKIVGDGSLKDDLLLKYNHLRSVDFLGSRRDVPELLWGSSLFVFSTTHSEGFGTVLLEALAAGTKVIASKVPACEEVLENGKYGVLVPPNHPKKLADSILEQFGNNDNEEAQSERVKYASDFSPEKMIKQYLQVTHL